MKKKNFSCLWILLCCFIASCSNKQHSAYPVIDLIDHKQLLTEEIHLSEISEYIWIIPLETNDSVLVGNIGKIKLETDKLYIPASNGVFVFDQNGKFLNKLGSRGRGPKEYVSLYDIHPEGDIVWLLDNSDKKALKYSCSGRFLDSFYFEPQLWTDYYYSGNDTFIGFLPDYGQPNTDIMLAFFDADRVVDSILHKNPIKQSVNIFLRVYGEVSFINHGNKVKFKHLFNDTIYHIVNNKLLPDIVLNLGNGRANVNARVDAANKVDYDLTQGMDNTLLYGESNRYVYLKVDNVNTPPDYNISLFFDKITQKVHKWKFILPDDKRIDIEESKKFIPLYIDKNGHLIGQTASADPDDNPVIIIAKLK